MAIAIYSCSNSPMPDIDVMVEAELAESRIRPYVRETTLLFSPPLSRLCDAEVFLKLETEQVTGSFKARGAFNKYLSLPASARSEPVVTASSGNHGNALAYVLETLGGRGIIYLPANASPAKVDSLSHYDAELRQFGDDCIIAELEAQRVARDEALVFVSPYSDPAIIGGQATIGLELCRQIDRFDDVLVAVGGGGLIAGIGGVLKLRRPDVRVIGCQPQASYVMCASVQAGHIVEQPSQPTLADGTAGGIDPQSVTFPIVQRVVDQFLLVSEEEIAAAIRLLIEQHQILAEGAGALSVASLFHEPAQFRGRRVVLVISGRKLGIETLREVLRGGESDEQS